MMEYTGSKIKKTTQINPANPEQFKKYLQKFVGKYFSIMNRKLENLGLRFEGEKYINKNLSWVYYGYRDKHSMYGFVVENGIITEVIDTY